MPHQELFDLTITQALDGLAARRFSAREYARALIARCEDQASLNALVSSDWGKLLDAADVVDTSGKAGEGLGGIPLCLKDNINTGILPTGAATGALADHVAAAPAPVAKALFDAGALLGGTGNMHELAFGITSNNGVTGAARNPWNPAMIPGGSSGGVAAAVAGRMFPGGVGTDTGASVRLPASLCGLVGFRPTVGRYSGDGIVPISHTRDTAGPITRSVADTRLLDRVMAGSGTEATPIFLAGLRLGVPLGYFYDNLDPAVAANADASLKALTDAGVTLVEADIADIGEINAAVSFPVALYEFMQDLPRYLRDNGLDLTMQDILDGIGSPDVKGLFASQMGPEAMPEAAYRKAMDEDRPRLQAAYAGYFETHKIDAIIFPTAPLPARPIGDDETVELNGERLPTFPTFIRNTDPASNAGIPGISLPSGLGPDGLPLGMELDGPVLSDDRLLAIAAAIEAVFAFDARPASA
ncbi:indoleacetamide hydrolase [Oricola nitratireducens]|uniref:indoleacetamide hydrolase n=1 Tax=Oricola nitratireducens TaxID=2775868 RepID=UPI0018673098|nr:indoleacetamide hydrolase [Oricola nitratireducens]